MSCTSLTKLFSGKGDVMAGALVMNGHSPLYPQLRAASECVTCGVLGGVVAWLLSIVLYDEST